MTIHRPGDEKQIAEIVAAAAAEGRPLEIVAGGSKRAFGRVVKAEQVLDVSRLSGIVAYEPAELVLTARPATPLSAIQAELEAAGQMLAFEPPAWRDLMRTHAEPTLGGTLVCNLSGSRRVRSGAARDYFLGFSAVNGRGEIFKAGGKVVKNVTGFDLSKLLAGSFGTLSVLTEITLKVMPRPETECTVLLSALADEVALSILSKSLNTPHEVSAVAHLPAPAARRCSIPAVAAGSGSATAIRLEGPKPSVAFRAEAIEALFGCGVRLEGPASTAFWREVGEVRALLPKTAEVLWRLCPPPSNAHAVVEAIAAKSPSAEAFYDWGGGLVWLSLDAEAAGPDVGAGLVRNTMRPFGGHSTLILAPEGMRQTVEVFEPVSEPLRQLTARVKKSFDPFGVLNPGRIREGL
jgi:glycolate oxidase FAD binding subunit